MEVDGFCKGQQKSESEGLSASSVIIFPFDFSLFCIQITLICPCILGVEWISLDFVHYTICIQISRLKFTIVFEILEA